LSQVLPEVEQPDDDKVKIASPDDDAPIMMAPPKERKHNFAKGYDRFHPDLYHCTGYEIKDYQWFDGVPKADDRRFVIDLKDGSMDRYAFPSCFTFRTDPPIDYPMSDLSSTTLVTLPETGPSCPGILVVIFQKSLKIASLPLEGNTF
jgi:hypothetical protein